MQTLYYRALQTNSSLRTFLNAGHHDLAEVSTVNSVAMPDGWLLMKLNVNKNRLKIV